MNLEDIKKELDAVGYYISEDTLKLILSAIKTKPRFLILSGPPGTGKTSLAVLLGYMVNGGELEMGDENGKKSEKKESSKRGKPYLKYERSFKNFKAFSPDGRYVLARVGYYPSFKTKIWEVGNWKEVATLKGEFETFSPDGKYVVTRTKNYVKIWEVGNWKEVATSEGYFEAFSSDGMYVVIDWGGEIGILEVGGWKEVATLEGEFKTFSPNGKYVATEIKGYVKIWEVGSWKEVGTLTGSFITFSPNMKYVVSEIVNYSTNVFEIKIWEVGIWKNIATLKSPSTYSYEIAFSANEKYLAGNFTYNKSSVWEVKSGKLVATFEGDLTFISDMKYVIYGGEIWDFRNWKKVVISRREGDFIDFITFSPDAKYVIYEDEYDETKILEAKSWKEVATLEGYFEAFSPDGKYMATRIREYDYDIIKLWEVGSWEEVAALPANIESFSPDGKYLATKREKYIDIWKIEDGGDDGNYVVDVGNVKPTKNEKLPLEEKLSEILKTCPYIKLVRVRPEWTNPRDILGYRDYEGKFREGIIYDFLLEANRNKDRLYFLILDEMNLSHPEHYLSDIISAMETGGKIEVDGEEIEYPENLVIIGTINRDETTQNLSPRLLSRAINVELRTNWDLIKEDREWAEIFKEIDENLKVANLGIGYREFKRFLEFKENYQGDGWKALDHYLNSKIMPRIRGLKEDFVKDGRNIIDELIDLAKKYKLVETQKSLERKREILERRGFVE